jgi:hypothetical protein
MSDRGFDWESILHSEVAPGATLKRALLTTYDRADERLLAENLLPFWLKLSREPESEGAERQVFLMELDQHLKMLHGKIVVISSMVKERGDDDPTPGSGDYPWIWRSIQQLFVGRAGEAVQHAKLWLLHWAEEDVTGSDEVAESIEIVVSSANLTMDALKNQIQGAWRTTVPLVSRAPAQARERSWGILPAFLRELGASSGNGDHLEQFITLLGRAVCPAGVSFVASVPGRHSQAVLRKTPWGIHGLGKIVPKRRGQSRLRVLSPYVGTWSKEDLLELGKRLHGTLELVWISRYHPWAYGEHWRMPLKTLKALQDSGSSIVQYRSESDQMCPSCLHTEHSVSDPRWSHAKVYGIKRGRSSLILVTSANFSQSAWGRVEAGLLHIRNFEFGVSIPRGDWPLGELDEFEADDFAVTEDRDWEETAQVLSWAEASWNGSTVEVACRCSDPELLVCSVRAKSSSSGPVREVNLETWTFDDGLSSGVAVWADAAVQPDIAVLSCGASSVEIPVFDSRQLEERYGAIPHGVDQDLAVLLRDEMLFEQYGGGSAISTIDEADLLATQDESPDAESSESHRDSYDVPAFVKARRHLGVVDHWSDCMKRLAALRSDAAHLIHDGHLMAEAFERQYHRDEQVGSGEGLGARMAAEEMRQLLDDLDVV